MSALALALALRVVALALALEVVALLTSLPISSFSNAVNRQLSADAFSEEIIHNGPILMKLYQPVLGVRFFKHSVYYSVPKSQLVWLNLPHSTTLLLPVTA